MSHFWRGDSHQVPGAVGVGIAVEKIVAAVIEDEEATLPSACDVMICSAGHNPMHAERMRIARDLWAAGIKAFATFESKSLEQLQEHCRGVGVSQMAVLKEQEAGSVRVCNWFLFLSTSLNVSLTFCLVFLSLCPIVYLSLMLCLIDFTCMSYCVCVCV